MWKTFRVLSNPKVLCIVIIFSLSQRNILCNLFVDHLLNYLVIILDRHIPRIFRFKEIEFYTFYSLVSPWVKVQCFTQCFELKITQLID